MIVLSPGPAAETIRLGAANDPALLAAANINPLTGLSTDYLNHFNEAVMLLEMLPAVPECREDVLAWRPLDYYEHFDRSQLAQRDLAIAAYDHAPAAVRGAFDKVCDAMRDTVERARSAIAAEADFAAIVLDATIKLKPLISAASALIHGHDITHSAPATLQASQAAIDAILQP